MKLLQVYKAMLIGFLFGVGLTWFICLIMLLIMGLEISRWGEFMSVYKEDLVSL